MCMVICDTFSVWIACHWIKGVLTNSGKPRSKSGLGLYAFDAIIYGYNIFTNIFNTQNAHGKCYTTPKKDYVHMLYRVLHTMPYPCHT